MNFYTSNEAIIKIKEEINKKGFFAFDVLENNFLSPDLKIYLKFKIVKNLNISNEKFLIFTLISFLIIAFICFFIFNILNNYDIENGETIRSYTKFFLGTSFVFYLSFFIFSPVISIFLDFISNKYLKKIEKIKRMILIFDEKIYVLNKEIKITDFNNLEKNIWEGFKNHSFLDNFLGKGKFFRKIFFETEEKIDKLIFYSALLEKNLKSLKFGEQNFSNFLKNIENINISIKKIFINMEKIKKIENINLEKLENYLKEKIIFSLNSTKNILEKNLDFINILLEKNKNSLNNQIILANKRLELQKNSLLNQINIINEKIKNL